MRIAIDWSYKTDKLAVYDGKKLRATIPKLHPGDQVYAENIPQKHVQEWLNNGVEIYRCRPNDTAEFRKKHGMPKTDELDALLIWKLANEYPDLFHRWTGDPVLYTLYKMFKEIQKSRVRQNNRVWAKQEPIAVEVLHDLEAIEKKIVKAMANELDKYRIWAWLRQIKGIDIATGAGIVAFVDKLGIQNLRHVSSVWHYFGCHVENGIAPKMHKGAASSYNPAAKALVLGIVANNFIRQRTPLYREIYDKEKEEQLSREYQPGVLCAKWAGYKDSDTHLSLGHAHNRAKRKMIKIFLSHLWIIWRQLEGLPTKPPFAMSTIDDSNYISPPFIPDELKPFKPY